MNQSGISTLNPLAIVLLTVHCFNASAFAALAVFLYRLLLPDATAVSCAQAHPLPQISH
jgi:hypothetical protein